MWRMFVSENDQLMSDAVFVDAGSGIKGRMYAIIVFAMIIMITIVSSSG